MSCKNVKEWEIEIDCLAENILWDADYDDADIYIDQPPEKSQWLRHMARISDNYFLAIADDLREDEIN
ncbi:MAG: hypothetical protein ACYS8Z_01075 [Planctomycetota bacterium]